MKNTIVPLIIFVILLGLITIAIINIATNILNTKDDNILISINNTRVYMAPIIAAR